MGSCSVSCNLWCHHFQLKDYYSPRLDCIVMHSWSAQSTRDITCLILRWRTCQMSPTLSRSGPGSNNIFLGVPTNIEKVAYVYSGGGHSHENAGELLRGRAWHPAFCPARFLRSRRTLCFAWKFWETSHKRQRSRRLMCRKYYAKECGSRCCSSTPSSTWRRARRCVLFFSDMRQSVSHRNVCQGFVKTLSYSARNQPLASRSRFNPMHNTSPFHWFYLPSSSLLLLNVRHD